MNREWMCTRNNSHKVGLDVHGRLDGRVDNLNHGEYEGWMES